MKNCNEKSKTHKTNDVINGAIASILFALVVIIISNNIGELPINNGVGWDGTVFTNVIGEIATGNYTNSDPYRAIRTISFPVIYIIKYFNLNVDIVKAQKYFNIVIIALSFFFIYLSMAIRNIKRVTLFLTMITFSLSWGVIVLPVFTPILTDHIAIFISCLSIYLWSIGSSTGLMVMIAVGVWIMPSSFLIPLSLIAFPENNIQYTKALHKKNNNKILFLSVISVLVLFLVFYAFKGSSIWNGIESHCLDVTRNITTVLTGDKSLLALSIIIISVFLILSISVTIRMFFVEREVLKASYKYLGYGIFCALASFVLIRIIFDFNSGYSGPPLVENLIKQSLSAPAKTWVSHLAYFGPAAVVVYFYLFTNKLNDFPSGVATCLCGFSFILTIGSESRQWISIYPIIIFSLGIIELGTLCRLVIIIMSLPTLANIFSLHNTLLSALALNVGLQDWQWQEYFGVVGPWMSMTSYFVLVERFFVFAIAITVAACIDRKISNKFNTCDKKITT